jgi:hypothetical protein
VMLTTHLHLLPRSRMRGVIPHLPQYALRRSDSSVVQRWATGPVAAGNFSLSPTRPDWFWARPASYPMGSFPGDKAAGA